MKRLCRKFSVPRSAFIVLLAVLVSLAFAAKRCPKCGRTYEDEDNYCGWCTNEDGSPVKLVPVPKPKPKSKPQPEPESGERPAVGGMRSLGRNAQGIEEFLWLKDSSVMVRIPAGEFWMGSAQNEGDSDEHPQHKVAVSEFYIDKHEVTNRQYKKFCDATGRSYPADPGFTGMSDYFTRYPSYPVVNVSWEDAKAYCDWAGKRLPTEAEWEKAARGTDARKYPWGNAEPGAGGTYRANWGDREVWKRDGYEFTSPVGSFPSGASPYGVMDMAGNVWEWCNDWYDSEYYGKSANNNPPGPSTGSYRVHRGGSWYDYARYLRCACRLWVVPSRRLLNLGFRSSRSGE